METIEALLAQASPALRDLLVPLIQPAIQIATAELAEELDEALETLPRGASRFGGLPDLPPGAEWPARDDVPMEFLAQVRLADVRDPRLPPRGSLLFFYNSQHDVSDEDGIDGPCCAVLFHDGADDADSQLLFQVEGDPNAGFVWGDDDDRLYFVMSKAQLAARDFSKVHLHSRMG